MTIRVYQYPKCGTCRKALAWLASHGVQVETTDLVATPIPIETLRSLHRRSGLPIARFFNTSGESYRQGGFKDRLPSMTLEDALAALAKDGKLVRRPIVDISGVDVSGVDVSGVAVSGENGDAVLVGFDEGAYAARFAGARPPADPRPRR